MLEKKMNMASLDKVKITDGFWNNYMEMVRCKIIPYQWEALNDRIEDAEPSYGMANFKAAVQGKGKFHGRPFQDSDVYKFLEAVAYSLMWHPDANLEKIADGAIDIIAAAQQPDGYLDTYYILGDIEKRFTNLMNNHELYIMGHMVEAAVAYYKATGKRKLLDVAIGYVDCVDRIFGKEDGKLRGYPGHEVAEMALVALYEITGEEKHLNLAKYFIDERGQEPLYFREETKKYGNEYMWKDSYFQYKYYQAAEPVREQKDAAGHAVRVVYLCTGMAEVAGKTEDMELFHACERLWESIVSRQMYITGAIGSSEYGEAFTFDYDLPNDTLYAETCAAIGLVFFARRMFEITKDGRYIDVMEKCLYNGIISGVSLKGDRFFYVNPLEVQPEASEKDYYKRHVDVERKKWFVCACCPPNLARLVASLGGYIFEQGENTVYINLFATGEFSTKLAGTDCIVRMQTEYPWDGKIGLRVNCESRVSGTLAVRIPGWCNKWTIKVNGKDYAQKPVLGYLYLTQEWDNESYVELELEMPVRLEEANPRVRDDVGKVTVLRGPLVYCLEEKDNGDQLQELYLSDGAIFKESFEDNLLGGVITLSTEGYRISNEGWNRETLYRTYQGKHFIGQKLIFIPYYAWANRGIGEMCVWIRIR